VFAVDSNRKGAIAETAIAAAATKLGIPVLRSVVEHGRYDLGFDVGGRILRVQCKWGRLDTKAAAIVVTLQTSRYTPSGYVCASYTEDEIDAIAVYCDAVACCYLLPAALFVGRRSIHLRLSPPKNAQRACITLAAHYELSGAVAQLEEHRDGIARVRGSSPLSSTLSSTDLEPLVVHRLGSNEFRNHFCYYLERAAAGEEIRISRRGRPYARLVPAEPGQPKLAAA
jgi:prevent-host-death family protein